MIELHLLMYRLDLNIEVFQFDNRIDHHDLKNIEFAQLLGMCDYMTKDLQSRGYKTYKYLPYGEFRESVPYLLRRVYENYPMIRYLY